MGGGKRCFWGVGGDARADLAWRIGHRADDVGGGGEACGEGGYGSAREDGEDEAALGKAGEVALQGFELLGLDGEDEGGRGGEEGGGVFRESYASACGEGLACAVSRARADDVCGLVDAF